MESKNQILCVNSEYQWCETNLSKEEIIQALRFLKEPYQILFKNNVNHLYFSSECPALLIEDLLLDFKLRKTLTHQFSLDSKLLVEKIIEKALT
jgi:hypothetical protein